MFIKTSSALKITKGGLVLFSFVYDDVKKETKQRGEFSQYLVMQLKLYASIKGR